MMTPFWARSGLRRASGMPDESIAPVGWMLRADVFGLRVPAERMNAFHSRPETPDEGSPLFLLSASVLA